MTLIEPIGQRFLLPAVNGQVWLGKYVASTPQRHVHVDADGKIVSADVIKVANVHAIGERYMLTIFGTQVSIAVRPSQTSRQLKYGSLNPNNRSKLTVRGWTEHKCIIHRRK